MKFIFYLTFLNLSLFFILPVYGQQRPNILVFVADDAGWNDFGCYGNTAIQTPQLDSLARQGMRFTRAFLTSPQCSPSRTSMLTGQFAHTLGTEDLHTPLATEHKTLAHYLGEAGYYSALLGKSHLGKAAESQFNAVYPGKGNPVIEDFSRVLKEAGSQPFFAWYAFSDPHRPYEKGIIAEEHHPDSVIVPPYLADTPETRQDLARYYDEIARMDQHIGKVLLLLEKQQKREETLILFLSDNGSPFTRAKGTLYDAGIQTPLIVAWPGKVQPNTVNEELSSTIQLAPTLLEAAGIDRPQDMWGGSMLQGFLGNKMPRQQYVFSERNWHDCDEHMRAVRGKNYKLIYNAYIEWPHGTAADLAGSLSHQSLLKLKAEGRLNARQAQIFQVPRPTIEFYNLEEDPGEFVNLAYDVKYRPIIQKYFQALQEWMEASSDFPPHLRRRYDNTDRITGTYFHQGVPDSYHALPEAEQSGY